MKKGKKYYAVKKGRTQGIFLEWELARQQVEGYPGAKYKSFATKKEANEYLHDNEQTQTDSFRIERLEQDVKRLENELQQVKNILGRVLIEWEGRALDNIYIIDLVVGTCNRIVSEAEKQRNSEITSYELAKRWQERLKKDENY